MRLYIEQTVEMAVGNLSLKLCCKPEYFETWHTAFGVGAVHLAKFGSVSRSLFIVQVPLGRGKYLIANLSCRVLGN